MSDDRTIEIEIHCTNFPTAQQVGSSQLRLGIQQKRKTVDDVLVTAEPVPEHIVFRFALRVRGAQGEGAPNFLGDYAQGTPATRFVYLCWGTREHDEWVPQARAKIPLHGITWEQIEAATSAAEPICATISCTDAKGKPITASLKPNTFSWNVGSEQ